MKMQVIINLARTFAAARTRLAAIVDKIRREQQQSLDAHRCALRDAVNKANDRQAELSAAIAMSAELFEKPRTVTVDGVRIGMTTRKGKITFEDAERTVELIKRKFPVFAETAVIRKETPDKEALAKWSDEDLARIGATREPDDTTAVVIKPTDDVVDKMVAAMLEDVTESTQGLVA